VFLELPAQVTLVRKPQFIGDRPDKIDEFVMDLMIHTENGFGYQNLLGY